MQTGHKLDKQDMVPDARKIMRTWYGTFMGHMGHELDGIQWGHMARQTHHEGSKPVRSVKMEKPSKSHRRINKTCR